MAKISAVLNDVKIGESKLEITSEDESSGLSSSVAKKKKTGGRVSLSSQQKISLAIQRSQISILSDDTTLESELAALYLAVSEKKLEELRKPPKRTDNINQHPRLTFLKIFDEGAVGRNQPVLYKLADLRAFQRGIRATNTFEAAVGAGLAGWMRVNHPFFVQKSKTSNTVILGDAWDLTLSIRDDLFQALLCNQISLKWMSSANAALATWKDHRAHFLFVMEGRANWRRLDDGMTAAVEHSKNCDQVLG